MLIRSLSVLFFLSTFVLPSLAQNKPMQKFPQLIAIKSGLSNLSAPKPDFGFVDKTKLPMGAAILTAAKAKSGVVWVVTDKGAYRTIDDKYVLIEEPRIFRSHQPPINVDTFVHAVASDSDGHIWAATSSGMYATDGDQWWQHFDRRDGMPYEDMNCLLLASNGDIWGGTNEGAWRLRSGQYRYFHGKRWLLGDKVTAIWEGKDGQILLQTDGGVCAIAEKSMTLREKAEQFDKTTQEWNNRRGYIAERSLKTPGVPQKSDPYEISDNDGLWNSIYVAAMCYRYAATKDPAAKAHAKQAFEAMLELERLSGLPGYPARAVVTDEELKQGATGVDLNETVRVPGETDKIWFRSPVDPAVWCKGDTSSDELDGHYYVWYLYYRYCADNAEKAKIKAVVKRTTDRIIDGGYNFIGHTGRKTRWGVWGPEFLNDDPFWWEQRPLNSLEILSYLKVAEYITGDKKYTEHYDLLIHKHHYLLNTILFRRGHFGEWQNVNHSDDEMAYMNYVLILDLEKDPVRRATLLHSLAGTWEDSPHEKTLKGERSPLYNFLYGGLTGKACEPDKAIETLQDWSLDRVQWSVKNSHRFDVTLRVEPGIKPRTELTRVLPSSERALARWNGNPWSPNGGSDGRGLDDGAAWLLGYWVGVFYGYLP